VQDEITATLAGAIEPELGRRTRAARAKRPDDLRAWDLYQRGLWHTYKRTREDLAEAQRLFNGRWTSILVWRVPMRLPRRRSSFSGSAAMPIPARRPK